MGRYLAKIFYALVYYENSFIYMLTYVAIFNVSFLEFIHPICIFNQSETFRSSEFYANKTPFIMGWGKLDYDGPLSPALQEAQINVIERETCAKNYANHNVVIDNRVLCAAGKGKDTCKVSLMHQLTFNHQLLYLFIRSEIINFFFKF